MSVPRGLQSIWYRKLLLVGVNSNSTQYKQSTSEVKGQAVYIALDFRLVRQMMVMDAIKVPLCVLVLLALSISYCSTELEEEEFTEQIEEQCCNSKECSCDSDSICCRGGSESEGTCCSEETSACCNGHCGRPCRSQFDVVACDEFEVMDEQINAEEIEPLMAKKECPNLQLTKVLYRAIRRDEYCYGGLSAKDPHVRKTVLSHVNCGSKRGYKSQYISFSTSLDILEKKYLKPGRRIVEVKLDQLKKCKVYDLTLPTNRERFLKKAIFANRCAAADCAVLLWCKSPIPCQTVKIGRHDGEL